MPKNENKSAQLQHSSLRQNTVKFGTDFTQARKKFTQALLVRLYVFPSMAQRLQAYEQQAQRNQAQIHQAYGHQDQRQQADGHEAKTVSKRPHWTLAGLHREVHFPPPPKVKITKRKKTWILFSH